MAEAAARNLGDTPAGIRAVVVEPPQLTFSGPSADVWRVQATISYAIAQSTP